MRCSDLARLAGWIASLQLIAMSTVVAVAWGLALAPRPTAAPTASCDWQLPDHDWTTQVIVTAGFGWQHVDAFASRFTIDCFGPWLQTVPPPTWSYPAQTQTPPDEGMTEIEDATYGLPFRCMQSRQLMTSALSSPTVQYGIDLTALTGQRATVPHSVIVPTHVLWGPFLANVALYLCALVILILGVRSIRGMLRNRQGRCQSCNYDLNGLPAHAPCPECGRSSFLQLDSI